jgi:diketogulonate reductase-like aldo/keto reductase
MPLLLYGTAWKEERAEALVKLALRNGFRGIDSANQGRHYNEAGTGAAVAASLAAGLLTRGELFLQSKYTFPRGHEPGREPYDVAATVREQVRQSFASSLAKLGTDYLDSYLLHGPLSKGRLSPEDLQVWAALEELYAEGKVRAIGVSNLDARQLTELLASAKVAPHVAQVRTFASSGWDDRVGGVWALCQQHHIVYEAYSLLTANRAALGSAAVKAVAAARQETVPQVAFRFALELGMVVLTGTTDDAHMAQDLFAAQTLLEAPLLQAEVGALRAAGRQNSTGNARRGKRPPSLSPEGGE